MSQACHKVMLAGNEGCRVLYCEHHQVAELEVGALSLRLDIEAFSSLNELLIDATQKIELLQQSKIQQQQLIHRVKHM